MTASQETGMSTEASSQLVAAEFRYEYSSRKQFLGLRSRPPRSPRMLAVRVAGFSRVRPRRASLRGAHRNAH